MKLSLRDQLATVKPLVRHTAPPAVAPDVPTRDIPDGWVKITRSVIPSRTRLPIVVGRVYFFVGE